MLGGQPHGLDVLGEGDLTAGVVVPGALPHFGFFAVGGALGSASGGVGAGGALPAFGVAVAGDEAFVAVVGDPLFDPRHGYLPRDPKSVMSAQCPHTLPRKSAKGGEGWRKLNMALTWDFTLTVAHMSTRSEPSGEALGEVVRHS